MKLYTFYAAGSTYVGFRPATGDNLFHKRYYRYTVRANSLAEAEHKAQTLLKKYGNGIYLGTTFMCDLDNNIYDAHKGAVNLEDMHLLDDRELDKPVVNIKDSDFSFEEALSVLHSLPMSYAKKMVAANKE